MIDIVKLHQKDLVNPVVRRGVTRLIEQEARKVGKSPEVEHFFQCWNNMMGTGEADFFVACDAEDVVGAMCIRYNRGDLFPGERALEVHWVTLQSARQTSAGVRLFNTLERAAKERRCAQILVTAPNESVSRFLRRRGFSATTTVFSKGLP